MTALDKFFNLLLTGILLAIIYFTIQMIRELRNPFNLDQYEQQIKNDQDNGSAGQ